jgi:diguanylate cyclase (GGDEF)-like protein
MAAAQTVGTTQATLPAHIDHSHLGHPTPQLQRQIQEYEALKQKLLLQVRREQLLGDILRRIRQSLNLEEILQSTADEVQKFLRADRVVLFQFDPQWNGTIAVEAVADVQFSMLGITIDEPCFRDRYVQYYRQGRMRAIDDIDQAGISPCHYNLLSQYQVRANLVVPVIYSDRLWGLVIAHHCTGPRVWKQSEIRLLAQLADQVAIAIYQGELYSRLAAANQELQELSARDALTGLANRRQFDQVMQQEWQRLTRMGQPLALLLVDVDFFKPYNDTYGHPAGDACLQHIAKILASSLHRSGDLGARYGGEEFALVLPNTPIAGAEQVAENVRQAVHAAQIPHTQSAIASHVTLSIGIGVMVPTLQSAPEALIHAADQALYQAKHQGRDRWCVWSEPDTATASS